MLHGYRELILKGNYGVRLNEHLNYAQKELKFNFLYKVSGSSLSDADESHPIFGDKAAISWFTTKICAFTSVDKCHNVTNVTDYQSQNLQQNDVKKICFPISKVRFSHMSIDLEGSVFEMCCFGIVMNEKMNLENLNATSKFGWREILFNDVVQALVNVPHLLKFSIMLLSY